MKIEELIADQDRILKYRPRQILAEPTFLPISLTGGIGDVIIAKSTIKYLADRFTIICYSPHADAFNYFSEIKIQKGKLPNFTWYLDLNTVGQFKLSKQFCGFLLPVHKALFEQQQDLLSREPILESLIHEHPRYDQALSRFAKARELTRESFPLYSLGF